MAIMGTPEVNPAECSLKGTLMRLEAAMAGAQKISPAVNASSPKPGVAVTEFFTALPPYIIFEYTI
jgi:hypothetical protein